VTRTILPPGRKEKSLLKLFTYLNPL